MAALGPVGGALILSVAAAAAVAVAAAALKRQEEKDATAAAELLCRSSRQHLATSRAVKALGSWQCGRGDAADAVVMAASAAQQPLVGGQLALPCTAAALLEVVPK